MNFMRFSNRSKVDGIGVSKKFEPLMNKYIMNKKVGKAIDCDTYTDKEPMIESAFNSNNKCENTRKGKNQKEEVVAFKKVIWINLMMVFVEYPEYSMHDVLMRKPSNKFHGKKSENNDC